MFEEEKDEQELQDLRRAAEYRQLQKDFADTFSTPHGERILKYILENGKIFSSVFTGNSKTYYLAGVQDFIRNIVVKELLAVIPDTYFKVMKQIILEMKVPDAEVHDRS